MRVLKTMFLLFTVSLLFVQCKKAEPVTLTNPGGTGTTVYYLTTASYTTGYKDSLEILRNSSHYVTRINTYQDGRLYDYVVVTYTSGKVSKTEYYDSTGSLTKYYNFTNSTSQCIKEEFINATETYKWVYDLGAYRKPKAVTMYNYAMGTPAKEKKIDFSYDAKSNNVTKVTVYDSTSALLGTIEFTYDAKKSAYANMPDFLGLPDEPQYDVVTKSVNNVTKMVAKDPSGAVVKTTTVTYSYDGNSYPSTYHDSDNKGIFYTFKK